MAAADAIAAASVAAVAGAPEDEAAEARRARVESFQPKGSF